MDAKKSTTSRALAFAVDLKLTKNPENLYQRKYCQSNKTPDQKGRGNLKFFVF